MARRAARLDRDEVLADDLVTCGACGGAETGTVCEVCGGLGKVTIDEWAEVVHLDCETPGVCECLRVYGFVKKHGLAMVKEYLYPLSPAAIEAMDVLDGEFDQEQRRLAKVKK